MTNRAIRSQTSAVIYNHNLSISIQQVNVHFEGEKVSAVNKGFCLKQRSCSNRWTKDFFELLSFDLHLMFLLLKNYFIWTCPGSNKHGEDFFVLDVNMPVIHRHPLSLSLSPRKGGGKQRHCVGGYAWRERDPLTHRKRDYLHPRLTDLKV